MAAPRSGEVPLYVKVRGVLVQRMDAGDYAPGDRLPSESVLAAELGVHRLTVRRAVDELARQGRLQARQGAGTFVTQPAVHIAVNIPLSKEEFSTSLRAQLAAQDRQFRDVLLSSEVTEDAAMRAELRLPRARLRRIDSALEVNGELWVASTAWGPDSRLKGAITSWRETDGVYGLLLDQASAPLHYVWRSFSAEAASVEDAELLGIKPGSPVLVREGLTADELGKPVLRVRRRARSDRVRYVLEYDATS
jgi:GntR family transcriptional regulator